MLTVTRYDRASAFVLAAVIGLGIAVAWLFGVWAAQHEGRREAAVPLELIDVAGGVEDGATDETLDLKTPFEETPDPSLAEVRDDETEIAPMLDSVVDLADRATDMAQKTTEADLRNAGRPGSRRGTGRAALGVGQGDAGLPREQRWFVRFSDGGTTDSYARQLDHFGIELAALLPGGRIAYLSKLSSDRPDVRYASTGAGEDRLYFTWQGGGRRTADLELFGRAGLDVGAGTIFHFYPPAAEAELARLERDYRGREAKDIRRTYFAVTARADGYRFAVTRQAYFR